MQRLILLLLFLITCVCGMPQGSETNNICRVAISEVHFSNDGDQFLELYEYCSRKKNGPKTSKALSGYRLLIVDLESDEIRMVVELGNDKLQFRDEEKYYVLTGKGDNPTLTTEAVQSVSEFPKKFPVEAGKVYGALLLRASTARATVFKLKKNLGATAKFAPRKMEEEQYEHIGKCIVDFWWFCVQDACNNLQGASASSKLLQRLESRWKFQAHPQPVSSLRSLSYCGPPEIVYALSPPTLTFPTPGAANACNNRPTAVQAPRVDVQPTSNLKVLNYLDLFRVQTATATSSLVNQIGRQIQRVSRPAQTKTLINYKPQFMDSWTTDCGRHLPNEGQLLQRSFVRSWLEVVNLDETCCFRCHVCQTFFSLGLRSDLDKRRKRKQITIGSGLCGQSKDKNHAAIMAHTEDHTHILAARFLNEVKQHGIESALADYDIQEAKIYLPTINLFKLVYTEILTDTPFTGHPSFVNLLKSMNIPLGIHYRDDGGALAITQTISKEFHLQLLRYLVGQQNPFSLILDGTHDNTNNHVLCVLIQSLEGSKPMNYLYHMIHLKKGETAEELYNALLAKVEEDNNKVEGFSEYFRTRLFGYGSDGAAVMVGSKTSLLIRLRQYTGRDIVLVRCIAHNLELASSHALAKLQDGEYFKSVEGVSNNLYTHYLSRGSKRWLRFSSLATGMGVNVKRFKKHYHVRWSSSHYEVIDSILRNYFVILEDLKDVGGVTAREGGKASGGLDPTKKPGPTRKPRTTKKPRVTKKPSNRKNKKVPLNIKLKADMYSKHFPLYANEIADLLEVFREISLKFETSKGIAFGKFKTLQNGIEKLSKLRDYPGSKLSSFVSHCECQATCTTGTCSLRDIETCADPVCNGYQLTSTIPSKSAFRKLSDVRGKLYESCVEEIRNTFDLEHLKSLELLNVWDSYTSDQVTKFCTFMSWDKTNLCNEFRRDYPLLVEKVRNFYRNQPLDALETWDRVLNNGNLQLSPLINQTVRSVLSLPMTTADAERAFSLLTRIKSKERSRLTPANMDHIIRIKINGPKNINDFDALYYVRLFLQEHVRADDESNLAGRRESSIGSIKKPESFLF